MAKMEWKHTVCKSLNKWYSNNDKNQHLLQDSSHVNTKIKTENYKHFVAQIYKDTIMRRQTLGCKDELYIYNLWAEKIQIKWTYSMNWNRFHILKTVKKKLETISVPFQAQLSWSSAPIYCLQTRSSEFMPDWSKPPHSLVFPLHSAFHLSIQIFILFWHSTVCSSADGSNRDRNHSTVYQKSRHCINNDVTVASNSYCSHLIFSCTECSDLDLWVCAEFTHNAGTTFTNN